MPYAEALGDFTQHAARLHVPGHKGGACTSPETIAAIGERVLAIDVPNSTYGIDRGPEPTALERSRVLAAEAWGARRTWFLTNGASQGNHIACLALAQTGDEVVVQRNVHSSVIHGLLLSGLRPTFAAPEVDPELGIVHCLTPDALHRALAGTPDAVGAMVISPTYFGAMADVRALTAVAHEHGVPLVVDEAWGAHLAFHESLPEDALSAGADLVVSSTHKILGSLSQSAMLHLGQGAGPWLEERAIDQAKVLVESTSPSSVLLASLDAARHNAAVRGRERLDSALGAVWEARSSLGEITGLRVVDERIVGRPGVHAYDPLRLVLDVRRTGLSGFELARVLCRRSDIHLELATEALIVALFGIGEEAGGYGARLVEGLGEILGRRAEVAAQPASRVASPTWGPLAMSPRQAFFGQRQVVSIDASVNRICAEPVAAYPPGIANLLPGERVTASVLEQLRLTLEHGGYLRGASDPSMRTLCVVDRRRRSR
jgi:arginine decarboxylase